MIEPVKWKSRFQLLAEEEIRTIHTASLRILEQTGLIMPLSRARQDQARDLGVRIEGERLDFPPHVVEAALKQAPRCYTLCARNPENDLLSKGRDGVWRLKKRLPKGTHRYKYIIDGEWLPDTYNANSASDDNGDVCSLITVR